MKSDKELIFEAYIKSLQKTQKKLITESSYIEVLVSDDDVTAEDEFPGRHFRYEDVRVKIQVTMTDPGEEPSYWHPGASPTFKYYDPEVIPDKFTVYYEWNDDDENELNPKDHGDIIKMLNIHAMKKAIKKSR